MTQSIRTTYSTHDPDYGTLTLGFLQETPLYAAVLASEVTGPLTTTNIMLYDPPADMNGADYIEASVEVNQGAITEEEIDETFTFIQTKGMTFAGTVQALVNVTIDLDQVDETTGGFARLESILVELLKYKISDTTTTQIGILTHTINKDIAGISVEPGYAEPTLSELFLFNTPISPKTEIGETADCLLQMRVKVVFSGHTPAAATTKTVAKCRLNCYRDLTKNTILKLPVI